MTETEFTDSILKWAKVYGWRRFHVRGNTRRLIQGDVGFPDLVLVRPPRLIFVELKVGKNKVAPEQQAWLDALAENSEDVYGMPSSAVKTYVWRPENWSEILVVLSK